MNQVENINIADINPQSSVNVRRASKTLTKMLKRSNHLYRITAIGRISQ